MKIEYIEILGMKKELEKDIIKMTNSYLKFKRHVESFIEKQNDFFKKEDEKIKINQRIKNNLPEDTIKLFQVKIKDLQLSNRASKCLFDAKIEYIYQLVCLTEGELLRKKSLGRTTLNEIKSMLNLIGLRMGMYNSEELKSFAEITGLKLYSGTW